MEYKIENIFDLKKIVLSLFPLLKKHNLFLINGLMGVGKTTFILELITQMGIENLNGSPTYSIINNYHSKEFGNIYHLDLYRLKNIEELFDIGIEEILNEKAYIFIEWPDLIQAILETKYCELFFSMNEKFERILIIKEHE